MFTLTGDASLSKRPFKRVTLLLEKLGAAFSDADRLPIAILPSQMHGGDIIGDIPSAQIKSAVLLASVQLDATSTYSEPVQTRNHTELMLSYLGVDIAKTAGRITIKGSAVPPFEYLIPGDISSAAYFISSATIFEGSDIIIKNVGLNPTRTEFLNIMRSFGADIEVSNLSRYAYEPVGDIRVKSSWITGGSISYESAVAAIDELPLIAMLGAFSETGVEIYGAEELRFKESDRIAATLANMNAIGAPATYIDGVLTVKPLKNLNRSAQLNSYDDHRIAIINFLLAKRLKIKLHSGSMSKVAVSYPKFSEHFYGLEKK
jgi:3-phosphoshikimate 1-carboxyvinyltransferase